MTASWAEVLILVGFFVCLFSVTETKPKVNHPNHPPLPNLFLVINIQKTTEYSVVKQKTKKTKGSQKHPTTPGNRCNLCLWREILMGFSIELTGWIKKKKKIPQTIKCPHLVTVIFLTDLVILLLALLNACNSCEEFLPGSTKHWARFLETLWSCM